MELEMLPLILAALLPAIALCIYIYIKDRAEKEPASLLLLLLLGGAAAVIPTAIVETLLGHLLSQLFSLFGLSYGGSYYLTGRLYTLYLLLQNFVGVALVEEGFKFLALFLITRRNRNFNSLFDGVIYAVFVSLGFAALENVGYALAMGWNTVLARAVTAIPGHTCFGVLMGCFYTLWHLYAQAGSLEESFIRQRIILRRGEPFLSRASSQLTLALVVPFLAHGFYDFCLDMGSVLTTLLFYAFLLGLYVFCFSRVRQFSRADQRDTAVVPRLLLRRYPELLPYFQPTGTSWR